MWQSCARKTRLVVIDWIREELSTLPAICSWEFGDWLHTPTVACARAQVGRSAVGDRRCVSASQRRTCRGSGSALRRSRRNARTTPIPTRTRIA